MDVRVWGVGEGGLREVWIELCFGHKLGKTGHSDTLPISTRATNNDER